ncbi:hypothetical protein [Algibacter lectus]|uniref:Uncharacterized protein n=1 Tax=Algibacter lectus TaxID=221126 RepID=A0A4R8MHW0_9FLAO|nr:hypothetical protein [Algibacter lectus]MWW23126.1 hypothetical protein [Algibacter lectus]TDY64197.1 hypothetical protein DFQ06_1102 [Algibacter lectus]
MELKYILMGWNDAYGEIQDKEDTLDFYRNSYEDEIEKEILEEALSSLENWSKYAYKNKLLFHITALIKDNDQPYADILFNDGNVIINFIDEFNRIYLSYTFGGNHHPKKLFLESLYYFIYSDDKEFYACSKSIKDVQYIFTPEGKLTVWNRYIEDGKLYEDVKEATKAVNVNNNWELYPKLDQYDSVSRLKRWGEDELTLPWNKNNTL